MQKNIFHTILLYLNKRTILLATIKHIIKKNPLCENINITL